MFIDQAHIIVKAGAGGNGCLSFRRERGVPRGGPDGGDGGPGGKVIIRTRAGLNTLMEVNQRQLYRAGRGGHGRGKNQHGKRGGDLVIEVPPGTIIKDYHREHTLKDLKAPGEEVVIARGGRGGLGNKHFASSTNRAPREWTRGEPGEERELLLELKLIADVGLVGFPNAGKSTLLSRLSRAHPKIAPYPFTTIMPQLGIVEASDYRRFILAEIPGLIEGAHKGAGLGNEFLRHAERTRLLIHVVDVGMDCKLSAAERYKALRQEIRSYSSMLAHKPELVAASKMDLLTGGAGDDRLKEFESWVGVPVFPISSVTGAGLKELLEAVFAKLEKLPPSSFGDSR